eukprot:191547-Heterocapsa_arctica.AAC.1
MRYLPPDPPRRDAKVEEGLPWWVLVPTSGALGPRKREGGARRDGGQGVEGRRWHYMLEKEKEI